MISCFKAHETFVEGVVYMDNRDQILTCGSDTAVNLFTTSGAHVGAFGQCQVVPCGPRTAVASSAVCPFSEVPQTLSRSLSVPGPSPPTTRFPCASALHALSHGQPGTHSRFDRGIHKCGMLRAGAVHAFCHTILYPRPRSTPSVMPNGGASLDTADQRASCLVPLLCRTRAVVGIRRRF